MHQPMQAINQQSTNNQPINQSTKQYNNHSTNQYNIQSTNQTNINVIYSECHLSSQATTNHNNGFACGAHEAQQMAAHFADRPNNKQSNQSKTNKTTKQRNQKGHLDIVTMATETKTELTQHILEYKPTTDRPTNRPTDNDSDKDIK